MKKQLFKSLIMTLLCLVTMVTGTYAWFAGNRQVAVDTITPQLDYNGAVIIGIEVYKYNQETNHVEKTTDIKGTSLTQYDTIFLERNENTPLIYKVTLLGEFTDSTSLDAIARCMYDTWVPTDPDQRHTSDLIYLKAASRNTVEVARSKEEGEDVNLNDDDDDDAETKVTADYVFEQVTKFFTDKQQVQFLKVHYIDSDQATDAISEGWYFDSKKKSVKYSFTLTDKEKEKDTEAEEKKKIVVVYLMIDYDKDLVSAHELTRYGQIEIMGDKAIKFTNDLTTFQFNVNY